MAAYCFVLNSLLTSFFAFLEFKILFLCFSTCDWLWTHIQKIKKKYLTTLFLRFLCWRVNSTVLKRGMWGEKWKNTKRIWWYNARSIVYSIYLELYLQPSSLYLCGEMVAPSFCSTSLSVCCCFHFLFLNDYCCVVALRWVEFFDVKKKRKYLWMCLFICIDVDDLRMS